MKYPLFDVAKSPEIRKKAFSIQQDQLHTSLLATQRACRKANIPIVIVVSGVEAAGKSAVVNRFSKWLDMRNVRTTSYWHESEDERLRPRDWRFWRDLPGQGDISILFGSWYTHPIVKSVTELKKPKIINPYLERKIKQINDFEKLLSDDGIVFIKLWFHISRKVQSDRIDAKKKAGHRITPYEKQLSKSYDAFADVSHQVIKTTGTDYAPWHVIASQNKRHRDLQAGQILLNIMQHATHKGNNETTNSPFTPASPRLDRINLDKTLTDTYYRKQLSQYQAQLADLHWRAWKQKRSTILVFEGWDAAGKGGAIRRLTGAMDARLFRVIPIAAPTDEEKAHHYLWRFWRWLPSDGFVSIYDRSWYGRVLVERVEGFAKDDQWQRSYDEIRLFEQQLTEHGTIMAKFWLHISPEKQLARFKERETITHKKHKLTDEDWRNREKWPSYEQAVDDMLARTDTPLAPWFVIPANDKLYARIQVLKTVCKQLEQALD